MAKVKKNIRIVLHAFVTLFSKNGSGARFREQLTHWTDPAVFTLLEQWKGFLPAMVTADEADLLYMRIFLDEITKNKYRAANNFSVISFRNRGNGEQLNSESGVSGSRADGND